MNANSICCVSYAEARPSHRARSVRIFQNLIAQREPLFLSSLRGVAMNELWEVELELVSIALSVGTLNLAQLALKARVHNLVGFTRCDPSHIAVIFVIE